ncbi:hypothetical protein ABIF73_009478 [Bradyrhizobium japonicum]
MLNQNIIREATRLTRSGQLVEATALLQRMLRGEKEPGAPAPMAGPPPLLQEERRRPSTPRRTNPSRGVRVGRPNRQWISPQTSGSDWEEP